MTDAGRTVQIIGSATLYLGDCFDLLPALSHVSAVVTDPPYGIGFAAQPTKWQRRAGAKAKDWDNSCVERLPELLSLGEIQCVWGGNYYALPPSRGWLAWFKPDAPPSMASIEFAWTNRNKNARQFTQSIGATNAERIGHPTQKPLALMRWCLAELGNPSSILDPFMGSGTTGVAALQAGASFIGIERDPRYFELACERIRQVAAQDTLFAREQPSTSPTQEALL